MPQGQISHSFEGDWVPFKTQMAQVSMKKTTRASAPKQGCILQPGLDKAYGSVSREKLLFFSLCEIKQRVRLVGATNNALQNVYISHFLWEIWQHSDIMQCVSYSSWWYLIQAAALLQRKSTFKAPIPENRSLNYCVLCLFHLFFSQFLCFHWNENN